MSHFRTFVLRTSMRASLKGGSEVYGEIDGRTQAFGVKLATRASRRGFLARVGKVALVLATGSVASPILPVNRMVEHVAASPNCYDGVNCGMQGHPCDCCGGSQYSCPSGTNQGTSWYACCYVAGCQLISYTDCCYTAQYCCSTPAAPNGQPACCPNCSYCGSGGMSWCGGYTCYKCTMALYAGSCGAC